MARLAVAALCAVARLEAAAAVEGFCCWSARDESDVCGTCLPVAKASPGSYCASSREACISSSCGSGTHWCSEGRGPQLHAPTTSEKQGAASLAREQTSLGNVLSPSPSPTAPAHAASSSTQQARKAHGSSIKQLVLPSGSAVPREGTSWEMEVDGKKVSVEVMSVHHETDGSSVSSSAPRTQDAPKKSEAAPAGRTPVERHGALRALGNKIVDEAGRPVRLRGASMFWSQWMGKYWNADVVQWLSDDWRVSVVRAAVGVEQDGYLSNPVEEIRKLEAVIQGCISAGVYVIVDWHDYHARKHVEEAKAFFGQVAKTWGHHPNVLFEPYNEPQQSSWRHDLKPYFEEVIAEIRKHSDNLVICGTRSWDEQVSLAASRPVSATNVAYTIHFYAASMGKLLRDEVAKALKKGVPVFVTEWGTCEYTGDGMLNLTETKAWLGFLKENHVSDVNWAISDKDESCSALRPGASSKGHWSDQDLTLSGKYIRASLRASAGLETEPDISGEPRADTASVDKPLLFK